jgi:hypothetical protein
MPASRELIVVPDTGLRAGALPARRDVAGIGAPTECLTAG